MPIVVNYSNNPKATFYFWGDLSGKMKSCQKPLSELDGTQNCIFNWKWFRVESGDWNLNDKPNTISDLKWINSKQIICMAFFMLLSCEHNNRIRQRRHTNLVMHPTQSVSKHAATWSKNVLTKEFTNQRHAFQGLVHQE